jgi:hypothetical protein
MPLAAALVVVVSAALTACGSAPPLGDAAPPAGQEAVASAAAGGASHHVVWDEYRQGRKGIHLRTARLENTTVRGARDIWSSPRGFVTELVLDRSSRRVALATCCQDAMPTLVVASLSGRAPREPLANHPEFYAVHGIAWSPGGDQLAFEGFSDPGGQLTRGIYTVRLDGTDLRPVVDSQPFTEDDPIPGGTLAWTAQGVLFSDGSDVLVASEGTASRVVVPGASGVRTSGNGRRLFTVRRVGAEFGLWLSNADGSDLTRITRLGTPGGGTDFTDAVPDRRGRALLGFRLGGAADGKASFVAWNLSQPLSRAIALGIPAGSGTATWN